MATQHGQQQSTPRSEASSEGGMSTHLSRLHRDILSAAKVVQQVQHEVSQLKQENEALRKELLLAAGGDRTSRSAILPFKTHTEMPPMPPAEPPVALGKPHPPTESDIVHPFSPHLTKEAERPGSARQSMTSTETEPFFRASSLKVSPSFIKRQKAMCHVLQKSDSDDLDEPEPPSGFIARVSQIGANVFGGEEAMRSMLFDPTTIKKKMRQNIVKADFNINRLYRRTGCAQRIARSHLFEHINYLAILLNTVWIAIDTEHNKADVLLDSDLGFQLAEHLFCLYFVLELLIRFAAFEHKRDCVQSKYFVFDAFLVIAMVFEDWIMTIVVLATTGGGRAGTDGVGVIRNAAIIRILRIVRLARLGRAVKLMRQSPEVMIMVKALAASTRCVIWTCLLLTCMIFFFGVCFTQMCKGSPLQDEYFPSLVGSLHTLLIAGLFPDVDALYNEIIKKAHFLHWVVFVAYLMMTTITILNLLIGVLVEVAQSSARIERDAMDVAYVKDVFVCHMHLTEVEDFQAIYISQDEFVDLLQDASICKALTKVGIDVLGLVDLLDFLFLRGAVGFAELLEMVLQLRSSANTTVRDLIEVRKFLTYEMNKMKGELTELSTNVLNSTYASEMAELSRQRANFEDAPFLN